MLLRLQLLFYGLHIHTIAINYSSFIDSLEYLFFIFTFFLSKKFYRLYTLRKSSFVDIHTQTSH